MNSDMQESDLRNLVYTVEEIVAPDDGSIPGKKGRRGFSAQKEEADEHLVGQSFLGEIIIPSDQKTIPNAGPDELRISDIVPDLVKDDEI